MKKDYIVELREEEANELMDDHWVGELVQCKDCKHRPIMTKNHTDGFDLKFPDNKCPCQCEDGWYSWYPEDNWFCADGERKDT